MFLCLLLFSWLEETEGLTPGLPCCCCCCCVDCGLCVGAGSPADLGLLLTELREELRENMPEMVFMKFFLLPWLAVLLPDLFPALLLSSPEETMPSM